MPADIYHIQRILQEGLIRLEEQSLSDDRREDLPGGEDSDSQETVDYSCEDVD